LSVPAAFSYLTKMNEAKASDLYLTPGFPPTLRIDEKLVPIRPEVLDLEEINDIVHTVLTTRQKRDFDINWELNASLDMGKYGRFRVNIMKQRQNPTLVIRRIVTTIPTIAELRLPSIIERLALERRGLVLLTGMTGSGKSTTLAAMLDHRNAMQEGHIITIEDPIEYHHEHKKSVVSQREVGVDTDSFTVALKNALRQRPDVILVGEIRDRDVMEKALSIAETGHLCLATLHTNNAYQAIERIVNFFPEEIHKQIRLNLSMNLKAVISQRLLPSLKGGLVPALEVMLNEALIRELIQKGRYEKVTEVMEQNNPLGMCTFDQSLLQLYRAGLISEELVINQSDKPSDMKIKVQNVQMENDSDGLNNIDISLLSISD